MIETSEPVAERQAVAGAAKLPVPAGTGRFLVLVAVFICAACGLVYELELIALADYLVGDTVTHTSVVLSLMVFAMGIGSLGAKRLRGRASLNFGLIEALLALVGGSSAISLYLCFVVFGESRPMLVGLSLAMGVLIGAEMPLLMTLIQRIRRQDPGRAVADLSAADYVGALLGGLAFPFLLLPMLGQLTAPLVTGVVNALAGGAVVLWLFRSDLPRRARRRLYAINVLVIGGLLACASAVGPLERAAERELHERDGTGETGGGKEMREMSDRVTGSG
jgi:predicted membrane-bound spermidine synthase